MIVCSEGWKVETGTPKWNPNASEIPGGAPSLVKKARKDP